MTMPTVDDIDTLIAMLTEHGFRLDSSGHDYRDADGGPAGGWSRYLRDHQSEDGSAGPSKGHRGVVINHGRAEVVVVDFDSQLGIEWKASFTPATPHQAIIAVATVA